MTASKSPFDVLLGWLEVWGRPQPAGRHRPEVVEARLAVERARSEAATQQLPVVVDGPAYAEAGSS